MHIRSVIAASLVVISCGGSAVLEVDAGASGEPWHDSRCPRGTYPTSMVFAPAPDGSSYYINATEVTYDAYGAWLADGAPGTTPDLCLTGIDEHRPEPRRNNL